MSALLDWLGLSVADAMGPPGEVLPANSSVQAAVALLRGSDVRVAIVADIAGRAVGLIDADGLMRQGAFEIPSPAIVEALDLVPAALVRADAPLHEAAGRMRREHRSALGVIDATGRPVGLLTGDAATARLLHPAAELLAAPLPGASARTAVAAALLHDGQDPADLQAALSALDDSTMRRLLESGMDAMLAEGWGPAPVAFAVLIMGSGGRRESFLHPDQDNGFVTADYDDALHSGIDRYFVELARQYTITLDEAGFPLCSGFVMATNPLWRKTITQWESQFTGWAVSANPQAVLNADIFLDFRAIDRPAAKTSMYDASLADRLRASVLRTCAEFPLLLKQVAWEHVRHGVPVGLFGQLLPDHADPDGHRHGGMIDLKLRATMPLIGLVRMLALRHGVAATGTLDRLHALIESGHISREFGSLLIEDFHTIAGLRLHQQVSDHQAARPVGNLLRLAEMSERDRARLVQAFRSIDTLRKVAAQAFGGRTA